MLFIDNRGITDPAINLALEEYVLKQLPMTDSYLLFYINEPSIIIGKNQNTIEEINAEYVEKHGIHVVRRLSGGGAVYHDTGNLNFSFLTKDDGQSFHNFRKFTQPIIDALQSLGVNAELTGRNDIQIGERKVSGNAMFATRGRLFSHGTLLFQSEMDHVASALKVKPIKVASKATKSVRSRVANITEFLHEPMTIEQFRSELLNHIFGTDVASVPQYELTEADWKAVHELADNQYRNWDWNYGRSPKCNIQNAYKFQAGILDVRLDVEDGLIATLRIFGDYFGVGDVGEVEQLLQGTRYEESALSAALESIDTTHYFGNVSKQQLIDLLLLKEQPEVTVG
ncbi:lipoate--protein ligase [Paenibacillus sp. MMS18-CY102]|uniref:lipoate--protein ligase n=1 Tax=Paenibacillus sp. MMS18-CY102 TaxID=2682849 RepID=UPI001365AF4C|nr:lipoate--protein ligase [Paenibacillus sp. MMS18-CY102]MWC29470.1 lipoate--protein ligase [Paenibacillus sp. MMS18-CY102]